MRAGIIAAGQYGVEIIGMLPSHLAEMRRSCHTAISKHPQARSATIEFALGGCRLDPTFYIRTSPVLWLLTSLWDGILPRLLIMRTWITALGKVGRQRWCDAIGPAAVAAHSLKEAGWTVSQMTPFKWKTRDGLVLDVLNVAPRQVIRYMEADLEIGLWLNMSSSRTVHQSLEGRPWLAPIRSLLRMKDILQWGQQEKGMLKCLAPN
eukprot:6342791-Karenia_brevis.AAC.1